MDIFTVDTLNKYIKNYKHDIILKLSNDKFTDKNISSKADLINMVLDYSPKVKTTIQFPNKLDISKLQNKINKVKPEEKKEIKKPKEEEVNEQKNNESIETSQKEEKKVLVKNSENNSEHNSESMSESNNNINNINNSNNNTNINTNINNISNTPTETSNSNQNSIIKNNSFDNLRLIQKHQIRIYVLSKGNYFEMDFSPNETIFTLKKKIYTKIENSVNFVLKHNTMDAYEIRPTKGMNIIYFKSKSKTEKEENQLNSAELKEKCAPDMTKPSFEGNALIKDLDNDALCFVEKEGYISRENSSALNSDSLIDDNKKAYGEYITDTGENQINCKIHIEIGDYHATKIVRMDSNACLRDVFEKISNSDNIKDKNWEYYYFVEHSEDNDNENMDLAISPNLEVKYLYPYIFDLYKKKFADVPNVNKKNNFSINFSENKNEIQEKKQEYVLNDTTAGVYQEFSVIKINSHNKRQERILGIDLYNLKNEVPKTLVGIFSRKKAKIQERKIKDIEEIKDTGEKTFEILISSGEFNQNIKTLKYEAPDVNVKNEIIAKLNYIMKMNNI